MQTDNKKIKNATITEYNGIQFRSKLELMIYKVLEENNLNPLHEPYKYTIFEGFKPTLPFYIKNTKTGKLQLDTTKQIAVTYTPDIVFYWNNYIVLVEVKPRFMCNDVYPYKRKLFRKWLEHEYNEGNTGYKPIYAQIGTKKEALELINILKTDYNEES